MAIFMTLSSLLIAEKYNPNNMFLKAKKNDCVVDVEKISITLIFTET
jgi:hypothetical protein